VFFILGDTRSKLFVLQGELQVVTLFFLPPYIADCCSFGGPRSSPWHFSMFIVRTVKVRACWTCIHIFLMVWNIWWLCIMFSFLVIVYQLSHKKLMASQSKSYIWISDELFTTYSAFQVCKADCLLVSLCVFHWQCHSIIRIKMWIQIEKCQRN